MREMFVRACVLLGAVFLCLPYNIASGQEPVISKRVRVVATLFPLYDFVREVGGARVEAVLLLPPGVEPHMYEPRPSDVATINSADIFVYTSDTMEPWVMRLLPSITNQNLLIMAASNSLLRIEDGTVKPVSSSEPQDPHFWLVFQNDLAIVDDIVDDLVTADEEGRELYRQRAEAYKARLIDLDRRYESALRDCRTRTIFYSGHAAFGQLARRYGLDMVSPYAGFSPDAEPTPRAVAGLISGMKSAGVKTVFFEELIDPKIARIIADETGAAAELLSAAHNVTEEELQLGVTFLAIMEDNLAKLRKGLECR